MSLLCLTLSLKHLCFCFCKIKSCRGWETEEEVKKEVSGTCEPRFRSIHLCCVVVQGLFGLSLGSFACCSKDNCFLSKYDIEVINDRHRHTLKNRDKRRDSLTLSTHFTATHTSTDTGLYWSLQTNCWFLC